MPSEYFLPIHNLENICASICAVKDLVDIKTVVDFILAFKGVEHRLEYIRELNGVVYYNDSIASAPTRTIAGVKSFHENMILIAGGYDKNLDRKFV